MYIESKSACMSQCGSYFERNVMSKPSLLAFSRVFGQRPSCPIWHNFTWASCVQNNFSMLVTIVLCRLLPDKHLFFLNLDYTSAKPLPLCLSDTIWHSTCSQINTSLCVWGVKILVSSGWFFSCKVWTRLFQREGMAEVKQGGIK